MKKIKKINLVVRLDPIENHRLEIIAEQKQLTKSDLVRGILKNFLKGENHMKKNQTFEAVYNCGHSAKFSQTSFEQELDSDILERKKYYSEIKCANCRPSTDLPYKLRKASEEANEELNQFGLDVCEDDFGSWNWDNVYPR